MINAQTILKNNIEKYNNLFSKNEFYPVQKAYSTPHFLVFGLRFPQKTIALYIGRGNQYQGIFVSEKFPPPFLRVQDRLLDFVRKYLVGAKLGKVELQQNEKLISFPFKAMNENNNFQIGYVERQLVFSKKNEGRIFLSSINREISENDYKKILQDLQLGKINFDHFEDADDFIEKYIEREEGKLKGKPILLRREKFLIKKIVNIKRDLENAKLHTTLMEFVESDCADFSLGKLKVQEVEIDFRGLRSEWEKRDLVFKKIKKLKRAEKLLNERLSEAETELAKIKIGEIKIEGTKEKIIQPLWGATQKNNTKENMEQRVVSFTFKEITCMLSLDAKSNDWLRAHSSKEHYWFHIENYSGAHLVLKTDQLSKVTSDDFAVLASLLRDYSKLTILEIPLMFSQLKHVKGMKGVQGEVIVKKPKYITCPYRDWKEIITF